MWAIRKGRFEIRLSSDGTVQWETCSGPRSSPNDQMTHSQYSVNVLAWEARAAELISIPAAWPAAVLQAGMGLVSRTRDRG